MDELKKNLMEFLVELKIDIEVVDIILRHMDLAHSQGQIDRAKRIITKLSEEKTLSEQKEQFSKPHTI